jgi:hypothetical protein
MSTAVETTAWLSSAERQLMRRPTRGDMPTGEEFLEVAGGDHTKAGMLAGAARQVAETRAKNAGMCGFIDAQRQADELSFAYYTLHGEKPAIDEPDPEELAEEHRVVERISSAPYLYRGLGR